VAFISEIVNATTVDEVVSAARDYLRVWEEVLRALPDACRRIEVKEADDVLRAAFVLQQCRRKLPDSSASGSYELNAAADFFKAAASRIRELQRKGPVI
jgi:hypothetical protein